LKINLFLLYTKITNVILMKKFLFLIAVFFFLSGYSQDIMVPNAQAPKTTTTKKKTKWAPKKYTYVGKVRNAKKPGASNASSPAIYPNTKPGSKNIVYQYIDTTFPNSENHFPLNGNIGIGTLTPQSAMEIKRGVGNTRQKNVLLTLSNEWAESGQNEPSIMFSNGDITSPANVSYWTVGARVSGDKTINTPQTFKVCFKPTGATEDQEFFSIDSYQGRVKIGNVNTQVDGYKLYVEEGILTEKVKVAVKNSEDWFDHVLKQDYKLIPIYQLEQYIKDNGHLPDMPTTEEVMSKGLDLGKMNGLLLKKVEELTLYMIEMKKELDETKKELDETKLKLK